MEDDTKSSRKQVYSFSRMNNNTNHRILYYLTYRKLSLVGMVVQKPKEGDTMFIILQHTNPTFTKSTTKQYFFCVAQRDM